MAKTDLTNQRQVFVEEYVRSGDHLEAAKKAGYKDTHTLRNQACKLRREGADEITEELHRNFAEIAPRALNILTDLAENAESESVRLGATRDLLDRAGFRPVDRHVCHPQLWLFVSLIDDSLHPACSYLYVLCYVYR